MTEYNLIRSKRKTISIHITKEAVVEVRAPLKCSKAQINRFVTSKQDWIQKHLSMQNNRLKHKADFKLDYGCHVTIQGMEYEITARQGNRIGIDGSCLYLPEGLPADELKAAVIKVYRLIAKKVLTEKVHIYSSKSGLKPAAVKINGAKTRWGSCSGTNSINFSWRLMMADDDVIDYVVVHELAHIKEHNHSERFWAVVADIMPDYKEKQIKLKCLQNKLADE